jgi:hypothetical protein
MQSQKPSSMAKPVILFKAPSLSVQEATEADGRTWPPGAIMRGPGREIQLEASAAELLIGYLRVARAYFTPLPGSRKFIACFYAGLSLQLEATLRESGRPVAAYHDIADLIEKLGCISDWQQQYPPVGS